MLVAEPVKVPEATKSKSQFPELSVDITEHTHLELLQSQKKIYSSINIMHKNLRSKNISFNLAKFALHCKVTQTYCNGNS